jgi:hypothetical protein
VRRGYCDFLVESWEIVLLNKCEGGCPRKGVRKGSLLELFLRGRLDRCRCCARICKSDDGYSA